MRLNDYKLSNKYERYNFLKDFPIITGMPYFGGKAIIGKYIYNILFDMMINMHKENNEPHIFIDAFTGGGKMALSMPYGWVETVVMNDLDYGVYCYFKSIQDDYEKLIHTLDELLDIADDKLFQYAVHIGNLDKKEYENDTDQYIVGALKYIACLFSYNGIVAEDRARNMMKDITRDLGGLYSIKETARNTILETYKRLNRNGIEYIIKNDNYKKLMQEYKGNNNVIWYLDPPYYQKLLYEGKEAPYVHSFKEKDTVEMTEILAGNKKDGYGEIKYFVKSDYDPKDAMKEYDGVNKNIFDSIEDMNKGFQKIFIGEFKKNTTSNEGEVTGKEYVWTHGLPDDYEKNSEHWENINGVLGIVNNQ